jgi:hypothetical protein
MNHRDRNTEGQRRIIVGYTRLVVITLFAAQLGVLQARADEPAAPPLKLVFSKNAAYQTAAIGTPKPGATETANAIITDCVGGGWPVSIAPVDGAAYTEDLSYYLCNKDGFHLVDAPANVDVATIIRYRYNSERSSFTIPPIGAVTETRPSVVGPLIHQGDMHAFITTFASERTPLRAAIYGGDYLFLPWVETFTATPPVSQYPISANGVFFVKIEIPPCSAGPCPVYQPTYGFASYGDEQGGTFSAFPFGK